MDRQATHARRLAAFAVGARLGDIDEGARRELKLRVLDSLGCAFGAIGGPVTDMIRRHVETLGGAPATSLIGGGRTAPDRAALLNGALVRYLDFNDSYLAPGETCHPSDNLAPVLAAAEYAGVEGSDFLVALAVAYEVQCRLSEVAPVRARGFDHTTQGSFAVAAGASRALGLSEEATANAIAISGTAHNALRVTRTGAISHWKGLAYPNTAFTGLHSTLLAMQGITGPEEVFEGNKGFMQTVSGPFEIDWDAVTLSSVERTIIKRYNAEIHSQSTLQAVLRLRQERKIDPGRIDSVEIEIFDVAYDIIGGGEEGDKHIVRNKEEADHSLPYLVAVALLDDEVLPRQYETERVGADDVQSLLRKVSVREEPDLSGAFPDEMPVRVRITLANGDSFDAEARDYRGFHTDPMSWDDVEAKFDRLCDGVVNPALRQEIVEAVRELESVPISELGLLLRRIGGR